MTLTPIELKFLLQLLAAPQYRTVITAIRPNPKTKAAERDRICMNLCSKGLVDYRSEVAQFAIAPAGRTLLSLDTTSLPVTPAELWTLRSCRQRAITPGLIHRKVAANERQSVIRSLEQMGMITVKKVQLKEAWLTPQGQRFLRDDYQPQGTALILSGNLLNYYIQFMRQAIGHASNQSTAVSPAIEANANIEDAIHTKTDTTVDSAVSTPQTLHASSVLETITQLDHQLNTDNYLPLFYLREQLQPPLTRDELDQHLYELLRLNKIELSTLQDVTAYSVNELAAGIPQDVGGALFFVSVN